jgi:VWFA-related protein
MHKRQVNKLTKRSLLLVFTVLLFPIAAASQPATKTDDTVSLVVTITDKTGRYVGGLSRDQVTVIDEDVPQEIGSFEKVNVPLSVCFVFDMPAMKRAEWVKAIKSGLWRFITASNSANEYLIAGLDDNSAKTFTRDIKSIGGEFDNLAKATPTNKSSLSDALNFGIVKSGANRKHVIVFVSNDDGSNALKRRMTELLESVKQSDVILYGIKLKDVTGSNLKSATFEELTSTSGGKSFYPTTESELDDAFDILALELAHQYSLAFRPANSTNTSSKWHRLQLSVKPLQIKDSSGKITPVPLFVRSRKGYYELP